MISASKSTLSRKNLKILRPKVTKNITNLSKKFCESQSKKNFKFCFPQISHVGTSDYVQANSSQVKFQLEENNSNNNSNINNNNILETKERKSWRNKMTGE
jgi:hypothetical protein